MYVCMYVYVYVCMYVCLYVQLPNSPLLLFLFLPHFENFSLFHWFLVKKIEQYARKGLTMLRKTEFGGSLFFKTRYLKGEQN